MNVRMRVLLLERRKDGFFSVIRALSFEKIPRNQTTRKWSEERRFDQLWCNNKLTVETVSRQISLEFMIESVPFIKADRDVGYLFYAEQAHISTIILKMGKTCENFNTFSYKTCEK
jgi:hypothetical protein